MENQKTFSEKFQEWTSTSISLKLGIIAFLIILLLIPKSLVDDLIYERQQRQNEAETEVTDKWSREQLVMGHYVSVPYIIEHKTEYDGEVNIEKEKKTIYLFPETLKIKGELEGESLHRGIFDVVVYKANLKVYSTLNFDGIGRLNIDSSKVLWDQAKLHLSVSDLRGIGKNPSIKINGVLHTAEPYYDNHNALSGLEVKLNSIGENSPLAVETIMMLKGSKELNFVPLGKTSEVELSGQWQDPSFDGNFLPDHREVNDKGFKGIWEILHFNRGFGQEFTSTLPNMHQSTFGLKLRMAVDQYQQSTRSSKYGILIILLSFLSLFLMETITKRRIHPLQYILIGLALILYYTLLISISEHTGFNVAYFIASAITIVLLGFYTHTMFKELKKSLIFTGILSVFYAFIFVITKEQDYALLIGSVGMFIALAATMIATKRIAWYKREQ
jgi:inner membrane protein